MYIAPTVCPACHSPRSADDTICANCGLFFASYAPPTSGNPPLSAAPFTYVPLTPGRSLANGRFTVRQALSKGGMGAIYLASDNETFGRLVVVKAMLDYFDPTDARAVQEARARFLQEARTLSLLRHPAIPQIFTYFQDGAHNYIVMEYIEGHDLEQLLTRRNNASGRLIAGQAYAQSDVLRWGVALCQVLVYLASRQPHAVVHHDIKPANLLLDSSSDDIRLVDFGTAKARLLAISGSVGLQQSSVHGTQGYAAPEQYRGQSEPRSDVYALAATLYHLATDDDPRAHPFSFPRLAHLGAFGQALRPALDADPGQRPTAAQLQLQLELLCIPASARPLQSPDGTELADMSALAAWCEQHWQTSANWLYDQLPAQIELWWGQTKLAHDLRAIVNDNRRNQSSGLDAMLALLDPNGFGAAVPQIAANLSSIDFGALSPKKMLTHSMTVSNSGRRHINSDIKSPNWMFTTQSSIRLAPGEQIVLQLSADPRRATRRGKLREHVLLQVGGTTILDVEARATHSHWPSLSPRIALLAVTLVLGFAVCGLQPMARFANQLFRGAPAAIIDHNPEHYQAGIAAISRQDWDTAIRELNSLTGTYRDDDRLLRQSLYNGATAALEHGDWHKARIYLGRIPNMDDAPRLIRETYALEARQAGATLLIDASASRVTFSSDNQQLLTFGVRNTFELRRARDGELLQAFNGLQNSTITEVAISPDNQLIAASHTSGLIKFWRADGTALRIIEVRERNGRGLAWSPDGQLLAAYGSDTVELWRAADGKLVRTILVNSHDVGVHTLAFDPSGQLFATGSDDGTIKIWRVSDGTLVRTIEHDPSGVVLQLTFRDKGQAVVAFDGNTKIWSWRVSDGVLLHTAKLQAVSTTVSAFSPDAQILATESPYDLSTKVTLWRVVDGEFIRSFNGHHSNVVSAAFSSDGSLVASVDIGGRIAIWSTQREPKD